MDITCKINDLLHDLDAENFPDYFGMDEDYEVTEENGISYLHRIPTPYFRNTVITGKEKALDDTHYYTASFKVKLNNYKQTKGAVKLMFNACFTYPWTPITVYVEDDYEKTNQSYLPVIAIKDLTDKQWHEVTVTFKAMSPCIVLQTPGYVDLLFDDFTFTDLGADETEVTKVPEFEEYKQYLEEKIADKLEIKSIYGEYTFVLPRIHSYLFNEGIAKVNFVLSGANDNIKCIYPDELTDEKPIFVATDTGITERKSIYKCENNEYSVTVNEKGVYINGANDLCIYKALCDFADLIHNLGIKSKCADLKTAGTLLKGTYTAADNDYALAFDDEFEGNDVNHEVWGPFWQGTIRIPTFDGGFRNNFIYNTSPADVEAYAQVRSTGEKYKPIEVKDGKLYTRGIHASKRFLDGKELEGKGDDIVGARLSTIENVHYQYGLLEIGCKIGGSLLYTSLWANGDTHSVRDTFPSSRRTAFCEIDLTESKGFGDYAACCIHKWWQSGLTKYCHNSIDYTGPDGYGNWEEKQVHAKHKEEFEKFLGKGGSFTNDYHVYSCAWDKDGIVLSIDGKVLWNYKYTDYLGTSVCNLSKHIILASRFNMERYVDTDPEFLEASIDYVRVYQIKDRGDRMIYREKERE